MHAVGGNTLLGDGGGDGDGGGVVKTYIGTRHVSHTYFGVRTADILKSVLVL